MIIRRRMTMVVTGFISVSLPTSYESWYVIHTPSSPPIVLPKSDVMRPSNPNREGVYPQAMEPTTIPNMISFFETLDFLL